MELVRFWFITEPCITDEQFYGALTPIIALSVVDLCYSEAGICEEFCPGAWYFAHAVKAAS